MDKLNTPAFTHVDYVSAIDNLIEVIARAVPEMELRNKSAAWVLCHRQFRLRQSIYNLPKVRIYNLPPKVLKPVELLSVHKDALAAFQWLNTFLTSDKIMPAVKVPKIIEILSMYPVINVRQMAEFAQVSEATAKRWLKLMVEKWLAEVQYVNGQNQYLVPKLLAIVDFHSR